MPRPPVSAVVAFSLIAAAVALSGCGGGGAPTGAPAAPQSVQPSPAVVAAAQNLVLSAGAPDAALIALASAFRTELRSASDPAAADRTNALSLLQAWNAAPSIAQLQLLYESGGEVYFAPPETSAFTEGVGVDCGQAATSFDTVAYYVNGVMTMRADAVRSLCLLEERFRRSHPTDAAATQFRLFYNRSGQDAGSVTADVCNALSDGLEFSAINCLFQPSNPQFCALVGYLELLNAWLDLREACTTVGGGLADFVQSFSQWLAAVTANPDGALGVLGAAGAANLATAIVQDVASGKRVVLVAHSQGNFFVEAALAALPPTVRAKVGAVGVATPTSYSALFGTAYFDYAMLPNDAIRAVPGAPAPNVDNALSRAAGCYVCTAGVDVHAFDSSYLGFAESAQPILQDIANARAAIVNEAPPAGQGFFQITLAWDVPGDIDLHVFEPSGAHVYYASQLGTYGELDHDDTTGTGPENYYVCTATQTGVGNYAVYVNNYAGATGTNAVVTVRAGATVASYSVTVGAANFGATLIPVVVASFDGTGFALSP